MNPATVPIRDCPRKQKRGNNKAHDDDTDGNVARQHPHPSPEEHELAEEGDEGYFQGKARHLQEWQTEQRQQEGEKPVFTRSHDAAGTLDMVNFPKKKRSPLPLATFPQQRDWGAQTH
ncbi:MAG: hypothetical protein LBF61_12785 [Azoarcus sp.]|nr:hypothetical protein [Azoarcus sp.]